ncbi:MAG: C39 family peptidase [Clostridia bacterium]|nr:C39 family peptidase [Clostridia bacterium]
MKKYISCIVLVILCLVCGMVFYANANELFAPNVPEAENKNEESTQTMGGNGLVDDEVLPPLIQMDGTIFSESLTYVTLRLEWAVLKPNGSDSIFLSCELYADTDTKITIDDGYIYINEEKEEFGKAVCEGTGTLLHSVTKELQDTEEIRLSAIANTSISDKNGVTLDMLEASGNLMINENLSKLSGSHLIDFEHISQFPSLPSGDEITCLSMVLNYFKYEADKNELSDLYLEKGPVGYTKPTEANVGNPESNFNSFGCLPPVIVKASNKFIMVNDGNHTAMDISGANTHMLYDYVSKDIPVIVWVCEDFDITPQISRIWIIDGNTYYAKSNSCTMVLIGYDFDKNTVTLANPKGNVFEVDMELFEARYGQMGSYCMVVSE